MESSTVYGQPRAILPVEKNFEKLDSENGAGDRSRTYDLLITNQLLYQLSYTGARAVYGD